MVVEGREPTVVARGARVVAGSGARIVARRRSVARIDRAARGEQTRSNEMGPGGSDSHGAGRQATDVPDGRILSEPRTLVAARASGPRENGAFRFLGRTAEEEFSGAHARVGRSAARDPCAGVRPHPEGPTPHVAAALNRPRFSPGADWRYCIGVIPVHRLKARWKAVGSEKPMACAVSWMLRRESPSIRRATVTSDSVAIALYDAPSSVSRRRSERTLMPRSRATTSMSAAAALGGLARKY